MQQPVQRQHTNPWNVIGWIVLAFIALVIAGALLGGHHTPSTTDTASNCPNGWTWDNWTQECLAPAAP